MKKSLSFIKIAGIGVYIHWTFSLIILWVIFINARAGLNPVQIGWSVLFILSLFVCVVLHELGHALTARRYGIKTRDITLYPIGGVARLEKMPEKPSQELAVALAGPLVNLVIMLLLIPAIQGFDFSSQQNENALVIGPANFLAMLGILNVWLALFNLIPAFPMDGGRVLRALLSMKKGRVRATQIAATIGKILALGFIIAGFYLNPFLIFIGLFIILGAQAEAEMVKNRYYVSGLHVRDALMTVFETIDANKPLSEAVTMLLNGSSKNFVVTEMGAPVAVLGRDQIIKGIGSGNPDVTAGSEAERNLSFAHPEDPLEDLFTRFQDDRIPVVIVKENGKIIGIVDAENIAELILVRQALQQPHNN